VIGLSGQFANRELGIAYADLVLVILAVQFVGLFGALLFGRLAGRVGAKRALLVQLVIWMAVIVGVWKAVYTLRGFWVASIAVGLVLGGTQALSRSLFSVLIPKSREAEYYGLYEVADKGSSWLAPLAFFVGLQLTHNYRAAIFTLLVFFVAGFLVLLRVNVSRGMEDARRG
jgi:UMF1 family MFS transporter